MMLSNRRAAEAVKLRKMENGNTKTLEQYIKSYMKSFQFLAAESTFKSDNCKANRLIDSYGQIPIQDFCHSDILDIIDDLHECYANKTINAFLTILRATFAIAKRDGAIDTDPMAGIKTLKNGKSKPYPFTKAELKRLHNTASLCESGKNAAELNVLTGLRISEILAIGWEDIDFEKRKLYVRRARVLTNYKTPKNPESVRTVELNTLAISILKQQLKITGKKPALNVSVVQEDNKTRTQEHVRFVFYNSKNDAPFLNAAQYNKAFFKGLLEDAGVDHRGAGQLRHTFASQNLTAGISKDWIAMQMGHTDTAMIDKHYGEWITDDSPDYANASAKHLAGTFGQSLPADETEVSGEVIIQNDEMALVKILQTKPELLAAVKMLVGSQS